MGVRPVGETADNLPLLTSGPKCADLSTANSIKYSDSNVTSEVSNTSSNRSDLSMNTMDEGTANHSPDFEQFFHEGCYKASPLSTGHESTAGVTDVDSNNSPCNRDKSEEECDNEDLLGGIFAFSEEGNYVDLICALLIMVFYWHFIQDLKLCHFAFCMNL